MNVPILASVKSFTVQTPRFFLSDLQAEDLPRLRQIENRMYADPLQGSFLGNYYFSDMVLAENRFSAIKSGKDSSYTVGIRAREVFNVQPPADPNLIGLYSLAPFKQGEISPASAVDPLIQKRYVGTEVGLAMNLLSFALNAEIWLGLRTNT